MPRPRPPRFTFFGGKGGVGKTTCAAAAAVRAAAEGARVLVVSTDPAHSLADALELELGAEARRVRIPGGTEGALRPAGARGSTTGELHAAELDADRALRRWLREREDAIRTVADRGTYLDEDDLDQLLSLSFPGVDELVGLVELRRLAGAGRYDHVVVDTAPTGHTLRLLEMPDTLKRLGLILDGMHAKHRFLATSLGGGYRPDFADEVIVGIGVEAGELRELVTGAAGQTAFTWVTLPEELSIREAVDGLEALAALGAPVGTVVVNRVWPTPREPCKLCSPRVIAERQAIDAALLRLRAGDGDRVILEVPALAAEPRGPAALLALALSVKTSTRRRTKRPPAPRVEEDATIRTPAAVGLAEAARLVLFGGKGGVGKTSCAAASAIARAEGRPKERVLLLSIDPAHSLGDALDTEIGDEARTIPEAPPNLHVRELDAPAAWERERARYRQGIDDLFSSIFRGQMEATFDRAVLEDLLDLAPPGIDELLALVTLLDVTDRERKGEAPAYDAVYVDTAPTGHTVRLLELPAKALEWVHALMSVILKYRSVIGLGELASDLTELAGRLRRLIARLADPSETAFVIVSRPMALPRLETERLARDLRRLKVPLAAIVANAVTDPTCDRCASASAAEAPEIERLERLALRAARSPRLIVAEATYPPPRGPVALALWRSVGWAERSPSSHRLGE